MYEFQKIYDENKSYLQFGTNQDKNIILPIEMS